MKKLKSHLVGILLIHLVSDGLLLRFSKISRFNLYGVLEYCKNEHVWRHRLYICGSRELFRLSATEESHEK
jgi:hypothetical protein